MAITVDSARSEVCDESGCCAFAFEYLVQLFPPPRRLRPGNGRRCWLPFVVLLLIRAEVDGGRNILYMFRVSFLLLIRTV